MFGQEFDVYSYTYKHSGPLMQRGFFPEKGLIYVTVATTLCTSHFASRRTKLALQESYDGIYFQETVQILMHPFSCSIVACSV